MDAVIEVGGDQLPIPAKLSVESDNTELNVLFVVTVGVIDFARMFYVRQGLEYATEEAARYFMLNPSAATATVTTELRGKMPGTMGPSVNVAYADTANCNAKSTVTCTTITATYSFSFVVGYLGAAKTLRATAQAVRVL